MKVVEYVFPCTSTTVLTNCTKSMANISVVDVMQCHGHIVDCIFLHMKRRRRNTLSCQKPVLIIENYGETPTTPVVKVHSIKAETRHTER